MKSYDIKKYEIIETPKEVKAFIEDIINLSKKHNLSISHEDIGGGFRIEKYKEDNIDWFKDASLNI